MTEKELINWAITVHAESAAALSRRYKEISTSTIANWKKDGKFPEKSGWRRYFQAQFDKSDVARKQITLGKIQQCDEALLNPINLRKAKKMMQDSINDFGRNVTLRAPRSHHIPSIFEDLRAAQKKGTTK